MGYSIVIRIFCKIVQSKSFAKLLNKMPKRASLESILSAEPIQNEMFQGLVSQTRSSTSRLLQEAKSQKRLDVSSQAINRYIRLSKPTHASCSGLNKAICRRPEKQFLVHECIFY